MHLLGDTVVVMRREVEWISVSGYHLSGDAMRSDFRHTTVKPKMKCLAHRVVFAWPSAAHTHENLDYNDTETRVPTVQTRADNNTLPLWGIQLRGPHTSE